MGVSNPVSVGYTIYMVLLYNSKGMKIKIWHIIKFIKLQSIKLSLFMVPPYNADTQKGKNIIVVETQHSVSNNSDTVWNSMHSFTNHTDRDKVTIATIQCRYIDIKY